MKGIICIETEWQITTKGNRRSLNSEPLIKFISEMNKVPYLYRHVATLSELTYYLKQFQKKEYVDRYGILYFSFHGLPHVICLEGEKESISLEELQEIGGNVFRNRYVHFSSCRTLWGSDSYALKFKNETGAKTLTGYTKNVDTDLSAIHDVALISEIIKRTQIPPIFRFLKEKYEGLERKLGFVYY